MNLEQAVSLIIEALKEKGQDSAYTKFSPEQLGKLIALVEAAEREACAKVAGPHLNGEIAAAIRARGE